MTVISRWLALLGLVVFMGCAPRGVSNPSILELERSASRPLPSSDFTALEQALVEDFQDNGRLDRLTLAQASLVVSGATDQETLRVWQRRYDAVQERVAERLARERPATQEGQARAVFQELHDAVFADYAATQSSVLTLLEDGDYNCVSATLLFNSLLEDLNIRTAAVELPTHTYSVIWVDGKQVEVETTHSVGFEPFRNEAEYQAFLRTRGLRAGVETSEPVLVKRSAGQRIVHNRVLLSYVYTNRATVAADRDQMQEAWRSYRRAAALVPEEVKNVFNRDVLLHNLALSYLGDGEPSRAMRLLLAASRMGEGGALSHKLRRLLIHTYDRLAELAAGREDVEELERIFASARARLPDEPRIRENEAAWIQEVALGMADDDRVEAAIVLLLRHVEGSPGRETFLHNCAVLAVNEANRRSEAGSPQRGEALLGQTLEGLRNARAASDLVAMVQAGLGTMHFAMERYAEAASSWRAVLDAGWDPNGAIRRNLFAALMNQAVRALNAGDCRGASDFSRQALAVSPSDAQAQRILARCAR